MFLGAKLVCFSHSHNPPFVSFYIPNVWYIDKSAKKDSSRGITHAAGIIKKRAGSFGDFQFFVYLCTSPIKSITINNKYYGTESKTHER